MLTPGKPQSQVPSTVATVHVTACSSAPREGNSESAVFAGKKILVATSGLGSQWKMWLLLSVLTKTKQNSLTWEISHHPFLSCVSLLKVILFFLLFINKNFLSSVLFSVRHFSPFRSLHFLLSLLPVSLSSSAFSFLTLDIWRGQWVLSFNACISLF